MSSRESRAAERRATWTGFVARSAAEAAAYERRKNDDVTPHRRAESI
ncbi:MAG: hypothetical protein JOZ38_07925 [Candidatus Eremiobacteraeota bacterium]|nr:hypothetical protein [Candidatus Eremiobacteraeota bacterium]